MHRDNSMMLHGLGISSVSTITLLEALTISGAIDKTAVVFHDRTKDWSQTIVQTCLDNELITEKGYTDYFNGQKRVKKMLMITLKGLRFLRDNSDPKSWRGKINCDFGNRTLQLFTSRDLSRVPTYVRKGNALLFVMSTGFTVSDYRVSGQMTNVQALRNKLSTDSTITNDTIAETNENDSDKQNDSAPAKENKMLLLSNIRKEAANDRTAPADIYNDKIDSYYFSIEEIIKLANKDRFAPGLVGIMTNQIVLQRSTKLVSVIRKIVQEDLLPR